MTSPEGYDHDFEVPPSAFPTIVSRLAARWPVGIAQLYGGVLIPFAAVADRALDTLGDGFSAYRDASTRIRAQDEGGIVDADGEASLDVFFVPLDSTQLLHIDFVFDNNGSPAFSLAVHEAVGHGISEALRGKRPSPDWTPVNDAWRAHTIDALKPHLPGGAEGRERAKLIALACWHRVRFESRKKRTYTQPPGRLTIANGRLKFQRDDAGPSPKVHQWK